MKYLSLFSGIAGFELGIQQAYEEICNNEHAHKCEESKQKKRTQGRKRPIDKHGVQLHTGNRTAPLCIGYSEIDKYAIQVYNKHFNHKNYGDITKIQPDSLPDFELIVGGFPCQSFSIAGKRGGFNDTRGTLFFEIARIIKQKQPRLLLLENVKGLLSHDKGHTFKTIISALDELGYDCQWQVLNSKNFGVPQNRERVFIIGHLRGTSRPEVFPIGETNEKANKSKRVQSSSDEREISRTLLARDYKDPKLVQLNKPKHSNDRIYSDKGVSPTLNTMQGGNRQPFIGCELRSDEGIRTFKDNNIGTLRANASWSGDKALTNGTKIRRLTPIECERLQGFPDDWTKYSEEYEPFKQIKKTNINIVNGEKQYTTTTGANHKTISDTQRYKMCGNAVTVNVIKEIVKKLI